MHNIKKPDFIYPNWHAPSIIKAVVTTKNIVGFSNNEFTKFSLTSSTGDALDVIQQNRTLLRDMLDLKNMPHFLKQTHSVDVIELPCADINADASYTTDQTQICVVLTADCMPILFTDKAGTEIAATHAGWRGLCHGVIENTVAKFNAKPDDILAWLGPTIGPTKFEVGIEVKNEFLKHDQESSIAFTANQNDSNKFFANLFQLAQQRLLKLGLKQHNIFTEQLCTYSNEDLFYSYRRDHGKTGRMAALIWFEQ